LHREAKKTAKTSVGINSVQVNTLNLGSSEKKRGCKPYCASWVSITIS